MTSPGKRYSQCDDTCTTDCGHCKGNGPPLAEAQQDDEPVTRSVARALWTQGLAHDPNVRERMAFLAGWDAAIAYRPSANTETLRREHQLQSGAIASLAEHLERAGETRAAELADRYAAFYSQWAADPTVVPAAPDDIR